MYNVYFNMWFKYMYSHVSIPVVFILLCMYVMLYIVYTGNVNLNSLNYICIPAT